MRIKKIIDNVELKQTWDIEVQETHEYVLNNGVMSHNTSSDLSNSTSGLDLPRDFVTTKTSKSGPVKQVVPNFSKGSSYYTLAEEVDNISYLNMIAEFQKYFDQSISTNLYWSKKDLNENGQFPIKKLIRCIIHANKIGLKTLYYSNYIMDENEEKPSCEGGGCSV